MISFRFTKKTGLIVFCFTISSVFSACDKIPWFKNGDIDSTQNQGVVQTDWNNTSEIKLEEEEPQPTAALQPTAAPGVTGKKPEKRSEKIVPQVQKEAGFSVQIGAFLKKKNATRLVSKLKQKGYTPSLIVIEAPGKQWNLVHIGSYTEQKSAEAAAKKFAEIENVETAVVKNNTIIKMERMAAQQAQTDSTPGKLKLDTTASFKPDHFSFQVGGFRTKENATKHKNILQKKGYAPYIKKVRSVQSKEDWYVIRIGYFDTIEQAADGASKFMVKENIPALATSMNE